LELHDGSGPKLYPGLNESSEQKECRESLPAAQKSWDERNGLIWEGEDIIEASASTAIPQLI
jgi:hypothetical protein